jgi:hypothetical protein
MFELRRALGLALLVLGLSGCIGLIEPDYLLPANRVAKVRETADLYGQLLRFGRIGEAAMFVRKEDRKAFLEVFTNPNTHITFTNAEIMTADTAGALTVDVWTTYELYSPPSIQIRTLSEHQVWHYDAYRRNWLVQPDLSVFSGAHSSPAPEPAPAG